MPSFGGKGSADLAGLHFLSLSWQKGETELIFTKPSLCPPWDQELARSQIITLTTQLCPLLFLFFSRVQLFATAWTIAHQAPLVRGDFPGKNTGVGCHFLLQVIFLTQGSNPRLLLGRWIFFNTEPLGKPDSVLTLHVFLFFQSEGKKHKPRVMWSFHERKRAFDTKQMGPVWHWLCPAAGEGFQGAERIRVTYFKWHTCDDVRISGA